MDKTFKYVSPRNITLTEDTEYLVSQDPVTYREMVTRWTASLNGVSFNHDGTFVTGNGPRVIMSRTGATSDEAEEKLITAILEEGWEFRQ